VYDLRHDPAPLIGLSEQELAKKINASWEERKSDDFVPVPVKTLQYNRCPAVAPLGVLEQSDGWNKIDLTLQTVEAHKAALLSRPDFAEKIRNVMQKRKEYPAEPNAEARLYDGFIDGADKARIEAVRNADARTLADFHPEFADDRLGDLLLRYKARNFPQSMSEDEVGRWDAWRAERLNAQLPGFLASLRRIAGTATDEQRFLLEELQLWAEAIMPAQDEA
jgi:exodeoxyribonuclease-1